MADPITFSKTPIYVYSGSAFVQIPGTKTVNRAGNAGDIIETTNHNSGVYREYVVSPMIDPGELTFTVQYTPSNPIHKYLYERRQNAGTGSIMDIWRLDFSDGSKQSFSGSLTKADIKADDANGILTCDFAVKLSGASVAS